MAMTRQFNLEDVLARAMAVFWQRGYEATSMQDLVDAMGINRGSLYATFGDKRQLFLRALRNYCGAHIDAMLAELQRLPSPRDRITSLFEREAEEAVADSGRNGCFLTNIALERVAHDPEIEAVIDSGLRSIESFLYRNLVAAQAAGQIRGRRDLKEMAHQLLASLLGLHLLSRATRDPERFRDIARGAAALLGT